MPITDVMRRDKAIFFFFLKISPTRITIGISIFINLIYIWSMFSFLRDITGGDAHRFSTFGFYLAARMYRTHPLPPISPRFWLAAIYRSRGFSKFTVIHKVISRLRRSIVIRFYPRRRLNIFQRSNGFLARINVSTVLYLKRIAID